MVSDATNQTNVPITVNDVTLRDDANGSITNSEISAGNTSDSDDLISFSGSDLTVDSAYETHIYTGDTYTPGANVSTGSLHVVGNYTASTYTLTLTGVSGTLLTRSGTFTQDTSTVTVTSASGTPTLLSAATTFHKLTINSASTVINDGAAVTVNNAAGADLTITAGVLNFSTTPTGPGTGNGTLTVSSGATLCLGGSASNTSATCDSTATATTAVTMPSFQTYTISSGTIRYLSDAATTVSSSPTYGVLIFNPIITSARTYTFDGAATINGNFTINPTAASTLALTVNLGGTTTVGAAYTTTVSGTTSGTSTLDTVSGSNYTFSTGLLNIATAGTLTANNSSISLTGTSGTLFTRTGTFTAGQSTVSVTSASGTPTLNSGTISFYNLTIDPTDLTVTASTDDITVTNTLNVASGDTLSLPSGQDLTHSGATLTLAGTISGAGRLIYQSASVFPSTGTISSILKMDSTNNDQSLSQRTYGGNVEIYNNSTSARVITLGTASSQTLTFSGNLTTEAANSGALTLTGATYNPTVSITGDLDSTASGGVENITTGTGTWTVSGNVDLTDVGTFTATGSTFQMNGTAKTLTSAGETLNNFAVTGGSVTTTDSMDVNGTFSVTSGTFAHGSGGVGSNIDISIAGNFSLTNGTTWTENTDATSQVIFDGDLTYTDSNTTPLSIGNVVIGASPDTTYLSSDAAATSLTINATDYYYTCGWEVDIGNGGITINGTMDATQLAGGCSSSDSDQSTIYSFNKFDLATGGTFTSDQSTLVMDDQTGTDDLITAGTGSLYNLTIDAGASVIEVEDPLTVTNNLTITAGTLDVVTGENNQINVGGNWTNDGTFAEQQGKVVLDGTSNTTLDSGCTTPSSCTTGNFYNLEITKTDSTDTVTLTSTGVRTTNNLTITEGTLVQGTLDVYAEGTSAVSVEAGATWTNTSTGDLTLGGGFANAGTATFQGTTSACGETDAIAIASTTTDDRNWSGAGTFSVNDITCSDMTSTPTITAYSSTNSGSTCGANWVFSSCPQAISGYVYNFGTSSPLTECDADSGTYELRLRASSTTYSASCSSTDGSYSFADVPVPDAGGGLIIWIDDAEAPETDGAIAIRYDGVGDSTNNIFYDDAVTVTSDDTNGVTIDVMDTYDNADDGDIPYTATFGTPDTLVVNSGYELLVKIKSGLAADSTVFDPGGTVTTNATGGDLHITADSTAYLDTATNAIGRDIEVDDSATLYIDGDTTVAGGDITTAGTGAAVTTSGGTPTVTMTTGGSIGGGTTPTLTFYNLATSGTGTTTIANTMSVNNDLTVGSGTTLTNSAAVTVTGDVAANGTLTVAANLNIDGGGLTTGASGAVGYTGTPTVDIDGTGTLGGNSVTTDFYILDLGDGTSDTTTLGSNTTIDNSLTVNTSQTFAMSTYDITVGSTSVTGSGDIAVNGATSQSASGTLTILSSASEEADLTGSGTLSVYNLTVGNGTTAITLDQNTADTTIDIANDLTITASATLSATSGTGLSVGGDYANSGTFTANGGTITFDSTDAGETLTGTMTGDSSFYNLTFNDGGNSGTWTFGSNSATVTNSLTITGGTVTAPSTTLTIGNDFTNSDGFTHNSGTVVFNNNANTSTLTYSAATTFYNFTVATGGKQMQFDNDAQTNIAGLFSIQGTNCTTGRVFLDSDVDDSAWEIYVSGTHNVDYADVEDSTAITTALTADSSTEDNLGNTNWTINGGVCTPHNVNVKGDTRIKGGVKILYDFLEILNTKQFLA